MSKIVSKDDFSEFIGGGAFEISRKDGQKEAYNISGEIETIIEVQEGKIYEIIPKAGAAGNESSSCGSEKIKKNPPLPIEVRKIIQKTKDCLILLTTMKEKVILRKKAA